MLHTVIQPYSFLKTIFLMVGCGDLDELSRHVMYHGYHVLLKALGKLVQESMNLAACRVAMEDQYSMLSIASPFLCQWKDCGAEFFCPDKFYRHVDKHGLDAKPTEDDQDVDGPSSAELKFVCTWCGEKFVYLWRYIIMSQRC